jgi:hypothetical protein
MNRSRDQLVKAVAGFDDLGAFKRARLIEASYNVVLKPALKT